MLRIYILFFFLWSSIAIGQQQDFSVSLVGSTYVAANPSVMEQSCDQQVALRINSDTLDAKKGDIVVGKITKLYVVTNMVKIEFSMRNKKYSIMSVDGTMGARGFMFLDGRLTSGASAPGSRGVASTQNEADEVEKPKNKDLRMPKGNIFFLPKGLKLMSVRVR